MESATHVSQSRWLSPGWTPKITSQMARLVHVSQTQVRSKAACDLCPPGGPVQVTLAFMFVLYLPAGCHDSLSLWVQPAPHCQEWPNVNMLVHAETLQWSTT